MCGSMNPHFHCGSGSGAFQASPFSAFHFLRNYNYLLPPDATEISSKHLLSASRLFSEVPLHSPNSEKVMPVLRSDSEGPFVAVQQKPFSYWQQTPVLQTDIIGSRTNLLSPSGALFASNFKRQRGEKKPIPEEQKDDKYFERRKRNNQAAKKSRDARKIREDQIALKAAILEHENAILRAQVLTLRDEASTLRQLLMEKKTTITSTACSIE